MTLINDRPLSCQTHTSSSRQNLAVLRSSHKRVPGENNDTGRDDDEEEKEDVFFLTVVCFFGALLPVFAGAAAATVVVVGSIVVAAGVAVITVVTGVTIVGIGTSSFAVSSVSNSCELIVGSFTKDWKGGRGGGGGEGGRATMLLILNTMSWFVMTEN